jgi:predicted aspartyl protease
MRVIAALLFLLLAAYAWPASVAADALPTAKDLRDRALAAGGPVPADYRETIVGTGSLGDTIAVTYRNGKDVRHTFDRGGYHSENGTYRGERWRQGWNGLTLIVAADPGQAAKDPITTTVSRVTQPFDAYVIAELNGRAAGVRTYYDPTTFRAIREERVNAAGTVVTTYDEFGQFGARTLPTRWSVVSKSSALEMHYQRTEYVVDAATNADVLEAPTRRTLVEFPPGVGAVDLPVRIVNHAIYVRVNIGQHAADFELDTGASGIYIDSDYAKSIGLALTDAASEVVAGRFTSYDVLVPEMRIGPLRMQNIAASGISMGAFGYEGVKPVGLLGFDFLAQLGVTLDYVNGKVHVVQAASFTPPADPSAYEYDVRLGNGVPMVTASVAGAVAERVMFDTGWSGQLAFFDYFTRRYPAAFRDDLGQAGGMSGVGGAFTGEYYRFHDVTIGPVHFQNIIGMRLPPSTYLYTVDGVLGNEILSLFTVSLDYTGGRIYLVPNDDTKRFMRPLH